jgi:hypothetical protein
MESQDLSKMFNLPEGYSVRGELNERGEPVNISIYDRSGGSIGYIRGRTPIAYVETLARLHSTGKLPRIRM